MLPWGGDYRGRQGAAEFFEKLDATMETVSFEVNENIEHGEEVLSFGTYAGRSRVTGKTGSAEWMFRWRVQDGKIIALRILHGQCCAASGSELIPPRGGLTS